MIEEAHTPEETTCEECHRKMWRRIWVLRDPWKANHVRLSSPPYKLCHWCCAQEWARRVAAGEV